jgi:hypothetical protein
MVETSRGAGQHKADTAQGQANLMAIDLVRDDRDTVSRRNLQNSREVLLQPPRQQQPW